MFVDYLIVAAGMAVCVVMASCAIAASSCLSFVFFGVCFGFCMVFLILFSDVSCECHHDLGKIGNVTVSEYQHVCDLDVEEGDLFGF